MSKTIRIRTTPDGADKYVKLKLDQDFDFLEVLSLKISQTDVYTRFSSDYGVIVGRVVVNGGFGVPNAKVSVFIPLDDVDKDDPLISGLYPYEIVTDKNSKGIRYNVLTQDSETENNCFTPVGTFPSKRQVLDNEIMAKIYSKYYKFTTTTNASGDFMIFGVPLGNHTVHVDADISDIGIISQRPYDLISKGTSVSKFDSTTKYAGGTNLNSLVQIKTLNVGVNVLPFWGDTSQYEIGITRLDLDLNYTITPSAIFVGGIFGDHERNSVDIMCKPRTRLGELKEQVTGNGTIRMIRKTTSGKIEEFNVDGGELIDDNGAWAYQIPMNLDYMVTNEEGKLVLTQDENKGIPTRARVRFNIGMNESGSIGRSRTRARYLVPNNPTNKDIIDYEFGPKTKDTSFRDLSWNKIYSVSNFIPRFQRQASGRASRAMTGIKDVDGADGNKVVFPYNRVNTRTNTLFLLLCIILRIVVAIITGINAVLIYLLNIIIGVIGKMCRFRVLGVTVRLCRPPNFIPCITVPCGNEDGDSHSYAPGCKTNSPGWNSAGRPLISGFVECFLFNLAKSMNLFQFDFYNDWINGSLFAYLLKYARKKNKKEYFCEENCKSDGVDGNLDGIPDNKCYNNLIGDTCFQTGTPTNNNGDAQKQFKGIAIKEGVIKKFDNQYYYAATTKNSNIKMFATEIISLGSIFECDWQGIPKIQQYLIPTTYKMPPDSTDYVDDAETLPSTTGVVHVTDCGNYFSVDCGGLHTNYQQCLNVRHMCEFGVNLNEAVLNPDGSVAQVADCILAKQDIDDDKGKWVRDVLYGLNYNPTPWITSSLDVPSSGFTTDFNTALPAPAVYNFANNIANGDDYSKYRNYSFSNVSNPSMSILTQPSHSYFFYFGLQPGNTGLDKMNRKFFASCIEIEKDVLLIESSSTPALSGDNGTITFNVLGGVPTYSYTITGLLDLNGIPFNVIPPISGSISATSVSIITTNLESGTYLITVTDILGIQITDVITVTGKQDLICAVDVTANASSTDPTIPSNDGEITIIDAAGGVPPYTYSLQNGAGLVLDQGPLILPKTFFGLPIDNAIGYTVTVFDSDTPISQCVTSGLTIVGATPINITTVVTPEYCANSNSGVIDITVTGGIPPYVLNVTGPNGFSLQDVFSISGLNRTNGSEIYTITAIDSIAVSNFVTVTIPSVMTPLVIVDDLELVMAQCSASTYNFPVFIIQGASFTSNPQLQYLLGEEVDENDVWVNYTPTTPWVNVDTPIYLSFSSGMTFPQGISIRYAKSGCSSNVIYYEPTDFSLPLIEMSPVAAPVQPLSDYTTGYFKFSINQLDVGYLGRLPYRVEYRVNNGNYNTLPINDISENPITLTGAMQSISVTTRQAAFFVRITDAVGCSYPRLPIDAPANGGYWISGVTYTMP